MPVLLPRVTPLLVCIAFCFIVSSAVRAAPGGPSDATVEKIVEQIQLAISTGDLPGCVVACGNKNGLTYQNAFGHRQLLPQPQEMTTDTIFDLASLTKPIATATSIMLLLEQGELDPKQTVAHYIPEFGTNGKESITIEQLLVHQSGLTPDNALRDYQQGSEIAWQRICNLKPIYPIGSKFKYSDVNFIVLGKLVEQISGVPLDKFARNRIFQPLGMKRTGFTPSKELKEQCAPTEKLGDSWLRGVVHDPRARLLVGVAGHAGLFSDARDLSYFARTLLNQGKHWDQPKRILSRETFITLTKPRSVSSGIRTYGWDMKTGYSSNRGANMSPESFGHGGFTGTVLWIDPTNDFFFIFLSNRLHPDGEGKVNRLAGRICTLLLEE